MREVITETLAATGMPLAHIGGVPVVEGAALALIVAVPVIAIFIAVVLGGRMLAQAEAEQAARESAGEDPTDESDPSTTPSTED